MTIMEYASKRAADAFAALGSSSRPVPESFLLTMQNLPALHSPDPADLVTGSSRLVRAIDGGANGLRIGEADADADAEGMFELPPGYAPVLERAGRMAGYGRLEELVTPPGEEPVTSVPGYVPDTEPIVFHPPTVPQRGDGLPVTGPTPLGAGEDVTIFGTDDRFNVYPNGYPLRCVCRIEVSVRQFAGGPWVPQGRGSGFLAGERILVTSGHMAPTNTGFGWMIRVVPGSYDGVSTMGANFVTFASDYRAWNSDAGSDMMVCRLYDPVGRTAGFFGAETYQGGWEDQARWDMVGYPFDRGEWRPTMQILIPVRDDDDGDDIRLPDGRTVDTTQVESEADRARGASGSPFYGWFNGDPRVVGVHHGLEIDWIFPAGSEKWSAAAGGPGLPAVINWARGVWP